VAIRLARTDGHSVIYFGSLMSLERSGELTIKTAERNPQVNPLERIASQAMDAFGTDHD
jgi:hypothetical protein